MPAIKKKSAPKTPVKKAAKAIKPTAIKSSASPKPAAAPESDAPVIMTMRTIPLGALSAWEGNVRKDLNSQTISELAASIPEHGLLQSLIVKPDGKDSYLVITGRHRLAALLRLRDQNAIDDNYPVPCQIAGGNVSLDEIGLAENIIRAEMNAADQYKVFSRLIEEGDTPAAVAVRFGVSETVVKKRMELGKLDPAVLQGYRDGVLNIEQLQAFTATNDQKKQKRYFLTGDINAKPAGKVPTEDLRELWGDVSGTEIRRDLTETEIAATDKRVRFVGLDAYRAAGGKERAWLFSDDENGIFLQNPEILNRLVQEKMEQLVAEVKAEGWSFVEGSISGSIPYGKYDNAQPKSRKLSPADEKTVADLKEKIKKIEDTAEDRWDLSDDDQFRVDLLEDQITQIRSNAQTWTNKVKETGGAFITMSETGLPEITRGLIEKSVAKKQEKEKKKAAKAKAQGKPDPAAADPDSDAFTPDMSKKIMMSFTTHQTFAVGATVARNPEAGLCCLLHPLAMKFFYEAGYASIINISATETAYPTIFDDTDTLHIDDTAQDHPLKGHSEMQRALEKWKNRAPAEDDIDDNNELAAAVLQWLLGLSLPELFQLAALFAGLTLADRNDTGKRHPMTSMLLRKFNIDMAVWYAPRAKNLFNHLGKNQLLDIIAEIRGEVVKPEEKNYKKPALAQLAEDEALAAEERGQPWLPAALRPPKPAGEDAAGSADDTPAAIFKPGDIDDGAEFDEDDDREGEDTFVGDEEE